MDKEINNEDSQLSAAQMKAMKSGEKAAIKAKKSGAIHLIDEYNSTYSNDDLAFAIGWNSNVFDSEKTSN